MNDSPLYDPAEVARLVRGGQYWAPTNSVVNPLWNRGWDANDKIEELLTSLATAGTFEKRLSVKDGHIADVYKVWSDEDCDDWYVKFYIDDSGLLVVVLSCKWWGVDLW